MAIGYKFTVRGQYHGVEGGKRVSKFYDPVTVILPEVVEYIEGRRKVTENKDGNIRSYSVPAVKRSPATRVAMYVIKNFYLGLILRDKYEDYSGVRTIQIVSKERIRIDAALLKSVSEIPIKDMTEPQLLQFHALHDLNCVLASYASLADRKIAVAMEYESKAKKAKKSIDPKTAIDVPVIPDDDSLALSSFGPTDSDPITVADGAVTSDDGIPIDEQDPAVDLLS